MFGRKKEEAPSREEFEKKERVIEQVRGENASLSETRDNAIRKGPLSEGLEHRYVDIRGQNNRFLNRMQEELAVMLEVCQKEATAINKEHIKLLQKAEEAVRELKTFEVEKLGAKPKE